jgi:hypothetical protein
VHDDDFHTDLEITLENRQKLMHNKNLVYWYEKLYRQTMETIMPRRNEKILEIGSGTSPLKIFYPQIITSDILELDYLDHVFDCHNIDQLKAIANESLDGITLTNVLHHLSNPLEFLEKALTKLRRGGQIIITEPYLSFLSLPIYKYLHPEDVDQDIDQPILQKKGGPLSEANQAIPYLIFFKKKEWCEKVMAGYSIEHIQYYTSLAYFITGGISRKLPVPTFLYKFLFTIDAFLAKRFPKLCASFFIVQLKKK